MAQPDTDQVNPGPGNYVLELRVRVLVRDKTSPTSAEADAISSTYNWWDWQHVETISVAKTDVGLLS